jgi:hypothetical protein
MPFVPFFRAGPSGLTLDTSQVQVKGPVALEVLSNSGPTLMIDNLLEPLACTD